MKRSVLILMVGCMMWLLVGAASALADAGPHKMGAGLTPDTCAACHRAHTGQAPYLLKEKQEQLCFTCHGSSASGSALDAKDGVGYSEEGHGGTAGALRGGGFKYALINTGEAGVEKVTGPEGSHGIPTVEATIKTLPVSELQPATSSHSVNESSQTAWGNGAISSTASYGASINLTCGSCHDPHGNGHYRILRPIPVESGAAKPGVEIPDEPTHPRLHDDQLLGKLERKGSGIRVQDLRMVLHLPHTPARRQRKRHNQQRRCGVHVPPSHLLHERRMGKISSAPGYRGWIRGRQTELHPVPRRARHGRDNGRTLGIGHPPRADDKPEKGNRTRKRVRQNYRNPRRQLPPEAQQQGRLPDLSQQVAPRPLLPKFAPGGPATASGGEPVSWARLTLLPPGRRAAHAPPRHPPSRSAPRASPCPCPQPTDTGATVSPGRSAFAHFYPKRAARRVAAGGAALETVQG